MNEENVSKQRAALMGLITAILRDEEEKSMTEIKKIVTQTLAYLIQQDSMVGDFIDYMTVDACKEFCEQEQALDDARNLLEGL